MALDFGMLQPANIAGNIMAGRQEAQRNQLAQQQLAMGGLQQQHTQMQLEQATRERDALTKMQQAFVANGKSGDLAANFTEMMNSGIPHFVDIGVKGLQSLQNQRNFESLLKGAPSSTAPPSAAAASPAASPSAPIDEAMTLDYVKNAPAGVSYEDFAASQNTGLAKPVAAPTQVVQARPLQAPGVALPPVTNQLAPAAAAPTAPVNQLAPQSDAVDLRRKIDAAYALGTPQALAWAQAREKELAEMVKPQVVSSGASVYIPGKGFVGTAPEKLSPTEMMKNYDFAKTQGFKGSLFDYERQLKEATRAPAQPQPPVAVVDPVTGKQVYVTREEALSKKMTPANAMEGLAPKEIQAREARYPQATTAIKAIEKSTDSLVKDMQTLRDHPGLDSITGIAAGRLPAITANGRAAQALYDKIVAKGGFQMLQDIRDASKTGGALGNLSNQEGTQLKSAFAAIDRKQEAADVRKALDEAISNAQGSKTRIREAYDMTYDYKNQGKATGAVDTSNPLLK